MPEPGWSVHLPAVIADAFGMSRAGARRLLEQGAVRLDGETVRVPDVDVEDASFALLEVGRRHSTQIPDMRPGARDRS
jgi:tyrosyl-tRNA synthetase